MKKFDMLIGSCVKKADFVQRQLTFKDASRWWLAWQKDGPGPWLPKRQWLVASALGMAQQRVSTKVQSW
jgi:hypothetical protein